MAVDQNRLDVAKLMFCFIICEGINAMSRTPTTRMMRSVGQVAEKMAPGCRPE